MLRPAATCVAHGQSPCGPSRQRSGGAKPAYCDTRGALRDRPTGAPPPCAGAARRSVLPQRNPWAGRKTSTRSQTRPHPGTVWQAYCTRRAPRGRPGGPDTLGSSPTTAAFSGPDALGICAWSAASARPPDAARHDACASCAGGLRKKGGRRKKSCALLLTSEVIAMPALSCSVRSCTGYPGAWSIGSCPRVCTLCSR